MCILNQAQAFLEYLLNVLRSFRSQTEAFEVQIQEIREQEEDEAESSGESRSKSNDRKEDGPGYRGQVPSRPELHQQQSGLDR